MLNSHSAGGLGGVDGQDVHSHYVRDCVEDGTMRIEKVHTDDNTGPVLLSVCTFSILTVPSSTALAPHCALLSSLYQSYWGSNNETTEGSAGHGPVVKAGEFRNSWLNIPGSSLKLSFPSDHSRSSGGGGR